MRLPLRLCAALLLVVVPIACSDDDDESGGAGTLPPATTEDRATSTTDADDEEDEDEDDEPREVLASTTVDVPFYEDSELEMAVTDVEVEGELMRVSVTFTVSIPEDVESIALGSILAGDETFPGTGFSPELIDPVHLKAYEVVVGDVSQGRTFELIDGEPRTLDFYFAAPVDDMESFDVLIHSAVPAIKGVPVPATAR